MSSENFRAIIAPLIDSDLVAEGVVENEEGDNPEDIAQLFKAILPNQTVIIDDPYEIDPADLVTRFQQCTSNEWLADAVTYDDSVPGIKTLALCRNGSRTEWQFTGWPSHSELVFSIVEKIVDHAKSNLLGRFLRVPVTESLAYIYLDHVLAEPISAYWSNLRYDSATQQYLESDPDRYVRLLREGVARNDLAAALGHSNDFRQYLSRQDPEKKESVIKIYLGVLADVLELQDNLGKDTRETINEYQCYLDGLLEKRNYQPFVRLAQYHHNKKESEKAASLLMQALSQLNQISDARNRGLACTGFFEDVAKLEYFPLAEKIYRMAAEAFTEMEDASFSNTLQAGLRYKYNTLIPQSIREKLDVGYASNPAHRLFSMNQIVVSSFFGTLLVTALMMFHNYTVLGKEKDRKLLIRLFILFMPVVVYLYTLDIEPQIIYNFATLALSGLLVTILQRKPLTRYFEIGGSTASLLQCSINILLSLVTIFIFRLLWIWVIPEENLQ